MKCAANVFVLAGLSLLRFAVAGHTQLYEISWFTIDGGRGKSSSGAYNVSGTIGQLGTGQLAGGSYTLNGGFWGVGAAVQTEGAPLLSVSRSGSAVLVKWSFPSTGFVLQQTTALTSPPSAIVWGRMSLRQRQPMSALT